MLKIVPFNIFFQSFVKIKSFYSNFVGKTSKILFIVIIVNDIQGEDLHF